MSLSRIKARSSPSAFLVHCSGYWESTRLKQLTPLEIHYFYSLYLISMLIYFKNQVSNFRTHLQGHYSFSLHPYDIRQLKEKKNTQSIPCDKDISDLSFNFLFNYNFFPKNILTAYTQWDYEEREMQRGDTIVQQVYFPPIKTVSQKIIVGVRIKDVFKKDYLLGFSYETLQGHIEKGISSFLIEKTGRHLNFTIHTYSKPVNPILNFLSPLFSSPYQNYCTQKALQQMVRLFKEENSIH